MGAVIAENTVKALLDYGGLVHSRVLLQPFSDLCLEELIRSLLVRLRNAGACAAAWRYFRIVFQRIFRWRSILRMAHRSDQ